MKVEINLIVLYCIVLLLLPRLEFLNVIPHLGCVLAILLDQSLILLNQACLLLKATRDVILVEIITRVRSSVQCSK